MMLKFRRIPRGRRLFGFAVFLSCVIFLLVVNTRDLQTLPHHLWSRRKAYFHLLIPATQSNKNLCRLLLSATALQLPSPKLIMWGLHEDPNPYVQHIAKVGASLDQLDTLAEAGHDDDLVLLIDGYDVWFQLGPEVILARYFRLVNAANDRLQGQMGREYMRKHNIYQSVVFGPDKICWPENPRRSACWAVPESTVHEYAFGPDTDSGRWREHYRARWLNSGTIMGPIRDVRRVLRETLNVINQNDTDIISDQFHFANVWGEQEYARKLLMQEAIPRHRISWIPEGHTGQGHFENITLDIPQVKPGNSSEYHITIDYESSLFQTMAYYHKYLGWVGYESLSSNPASITSASPPRASSALLLPQDIASSPEPLPWLGSQLTRQEHGRVVASGYNMDNYSRDPSPVDMPVPADLKWHDLELFTNIVTRQVPSLMHFTPPKEYRDRFWNKMWYFPYGRSIIAGARDVTSRFLLSGSNGIEWWSYEGDGIANNDNERERVFGGGWSGSQDWMTWDELCASHEEALFHNDLTDR